MAESAFQGGNGKDNATARGHTRKSDPPSNKEQMTGDNKSRLSAIKTACNSNHARCQVPHKSSLYSNLETAPLVSFNLTNFSTASSKLSVSLRPFCSSSLDLTLTDRFVISSSPTTKIKFHRATSALRIFFLSVSGETSASAKRPLSQSLAATSMA